METIPPEYFGLMVMLIMSALLISAMLTCAFAAVVARWRLSMMRCTILQLLRVKKIRRELIFIF